MSIAPSGNFESGFIAGGFGGLTDPYASILSGGNIYFGTAISATSVGIGSILGGGKFGNGAVTGAFGYLFNAMGSHPSGVGWNNLVGKIAENFEVFLLELQGYKPPALLRDAESGSKGGSPRFARDDGGWGRCVNGG